MRWVTTIFVAQYQMLIRNSLFGAEQGIFVPNREFRRRGRASQKFFTATPISHDRIGPFPNCVGWDGRPSPTWTDWLVQAVTGCLSRESR
jgi:hypothetical protein